MRSYWIRVGPNPMTGVLIGRENRDTQTHKGKTRDTQTHRGKTKQRQTQEEGRVRMEAETSAAPRQGLPGTTSPAGTGREAWNSFSQGFRGVDFGPLELRENRFLF